MAKQGDKEPSSVRLPGDPITEPREVQISADHVSAAPAREKKPTTERVEARAERVEAKPATATTDRVEPKAAASTAAPEKVEPEGDGPHNNYGVAEPTTSKPDDWVKYDEDVIKAKDKYEADKKKAAKKDGDAEPVAAAAKPEDKPEDKPATEQTYEPPPARAEAAALAASDEFELEPGNKWKRADIVNEILSKRQEAAEAQSFKTLTGFNSYPDFERTWKPMLDELRAEPQLGQYFDSVKDEYYARKADPEYAAFMDENRQRWLEYKPETFAAKDKNQQQQTGDPVARKRIEALETELRNERQTKAQSEQRVQLQQRITAERVGLWNSYPVLKDEPALWEAIKAHTILRNQQERARTGQPSTYTLTDSVRDNWPLVQKFLAQQQGAVATATAPVAVRARGQEGGGASSRQDDEARERQFMSPEEAAADWARRYPNGYTG